MREETGGPWRVDGDGEDAGSLGDQCLKDRPRGSDGRDALRKQRPSQTGSPDVTGRGEWGDGQPGTPHVLPETTAATAKDNEGHIPNAPP